MHKILIISYGFPPALSGATWRPLKFAKYLPSFDVKTDVFTVSANNYEKEDYGLLNELDESVNIYRVAPPIRRATTQKIRSEITQEKKEQIFSSKSFSLKQKILLFIRNTILVPDVDILWGLKSIPTIIKLIRKNKYDYILCTSPPNSVLVVGYLIKLITGIKLISDFRDPWTQWFTTVTKAESGVRKKTGLFLEKKILNKSDLVLATTPAMLDYLKRRINSKDDKFHLIYNGVDPDDFSNISAKKFDKCTIVYTGLINETFYSPEILFKSIVELKNERSDLSSAIQFIFLGKITQPVFDLIEKYDIDDIVFYKGFLPKKETISYIKGANYLLLLLNPGVTDYLTISGKIFEYLFSENKILALIPKKSAAGEILKDYSNSLILNPLDVKIIKQTIKDIVNNSEKEQILRINDKIIIAKFNRKLQSEQLANLIK